METRNPLEVLFCDLCNASVPLSDVQSGVARQAAGKTVVLCERMARDREGAPADGLSQLFVAHSRRVCVSGSTRVRRTCVVGSGTTFTAGST
jgi:hypothetical protein